MNKQQFLDEIENDINLIIDGHYAFHVDPIMQKIENFINSKHWNAAAHLPTPDMPLKVMFDDGTVVDGIRPGYISDRGNDDLGYCDVDGKPLLNVIKWTIA